MKKVIVLGANGATGRLLVKDLLNREIEVIALVRSPVSAVTEHNDSPNYREVVASISDMPDGELIPLLKECDAVFSCLGHNLTFKGIYGEPRRLVKNAIATISRLIEAIKPERRVKVILMNTTGNSNRDTQESPPLSQRVVVWILRFLLPPHVDNEKAADFLWSDIGHDHPVIEWSVVRPDSLVDEPEVTDYETHPSPIRNAIFDAGSTSRINVANFMASLADDSGLWDRWKGKMPVIYNVS
ncbi:MAG: NAD(P)-binding oxidoreductase [Pseudomonadota bacterium]